MIGHPDDTMRSVELACNASFTDFLAREPLPWVRTRFQISTHPPQAIVGGMSLGGLAAAYAGLRYPTLFGNILSQSGAFYWKPEQEVEYEWLTRQFVASPRLPLKRYLSVGLLETRPAMGTRPNLLIANRHLRDMSERSGNTFERRLTCKTTGKLDILMETENKYNSGATRVSPTRHRPRWNPAYAATQ
ncbi:MAG TPA: alpha/beta hydrolase-fold protein [Ktedonobacteraceae bacterium]|jgi:pimeloyl-ACP methyl ester carboxylesterase|nr:alpha/beta hydrolase-fold protein [Ktedonobacteraceae bacterium]